jgi:hypothetical protein
MLENESPHFPLTFQVLITPYEFQTPCPLCIGLRVTLAGRLNLLDIILSSLVLIVDSDHLMMIGTSLPLIVIISPILVVSLILSHFFAKSTPSC